jgi:3-dehydroquinate synthase
LPPQEAQRIEKLLAKLELPTKIQAPKSALLEALGKDKKRQGEQIHFVLLDEIGHAFVEMISIAELAAAIN